MTDPKTEKSDLFLLEGTLAEFHVSRDKEDLLQQVEKHYKSKSVVSGLGALVGDLYGQASAAASIAMYKGECTENFICTIDDRLVCGTFAGASKLPVGKAVKAAVEKQGDVYVAKGILSESDGFVWVTHAWGKQAERMANFKIALWCFLFQFAAMMCMTLFSGDYKTDVFWYMLKASVIGGGVICFGVALWSNATMSSLADPAIEILRLLGFADPERVNLNSYQYGITHLNTLIHSNDSEANHANIHYYRKAVDEGKIRMSSEERQ